MQARTVKSRLRRWASIAVVASAALAACGSDDEETAGDTSPPASGGPATSGSSSGSPTTAAAGQPVKGGTLTYLTSSDVATGLDPHMSTNPIDQTNVAPRLFPIYDALVTLGGSEKRGEVLYRQAESMASTDGLVWTMKLRSGIKFSDGTALDAEAVKFNFERIASPDTKSPKALVAQNIASMQVVDATTLRITLAKADGSFPATVASEMPYVGSPTALKANAASFLTKPIGAGAYTVKEFVKDSQLILERNPTYSGTTNLDTIVIKPIADETQRLNTVVSGAADMAYTALDTTVNAATKAKLQTIPTTFDGGVGFRFNMKKAPFDDIRARQAVLYAIDVAALNEAAFAGNADPSTGLFGPESPYYDAKVVQPKYDRAKAQKLFDDLAAEGKPVKFLIRTTYDPMAQAIQALLATYKNVSVEINSAGTPAEAFQDTVQGKFDAYLAPHRTPAIIAGITSYYGSQGPVNVGRWSNAAVDAALAAARATTDPAEVTKQLKIVQAEAMKDVPVAFFAVPKSTLLTNGKVKGFTAFFENCPDFTKIWKA